MQLDFLSICREKRTKDKFMFCENLQFNLSLYTDDCLTDEEREVLDEHLAQCPLCRQKLADFQSLRNDLRVLSRWEMPENLLYSIRNTVAAELQTVETKPVFVFTGSFRSSLERFLMPYTVGSVAALVFGFVLFWGLTAGNVPTGDFSRYNSPSKSTILLANGNPKGFINDFDLTEEDFATANLPISDASPSVNPTGALVALAKSFARGEMKDEEVVVVADVFGNGLAHIAQVVEPGSNRQAVYELEKALQTDPDFAPFVPAKLDNRSQTVRVVLKIQRVDVIVDKPRRNRYQTESF